MSRRPALGVVVVALAAAVALYAPAQEKEGRKVAVLVGVNDCDGGLTKLKYAEKDVNDLAVVLKSLGYEVVLLTRTELQKNAPKDSKHPGPTADVVRKELATIAKGLKRSDTLLVALSGHGAHLKATDKFYFCPSGTDLSATKTLVALDEIMAVFKDCNAASKVLLVDACRNDPTDGRGLPNIKAETRPLLPEPPGGTVALFSCSKGQQAHESNEKQRGYMFHYVIEGLSGRAANKKGELNWLRLVAYVNDELPEAVSDERKLKQTPEVFGEARSLVLGKVHITRVERPLTAPFKPADVVATRRAYAKLDQPESVSGRNGMQLMYIPPGTFMTGSTEPAASIVKGFPIEEEETFANEFPRQKAEIRHGFYMGTTEVTVGQFREFVNDKNHKTDFERGVATPNQTGAASDKDNRRWNDTLHELRSDELPVTHVTHNDAVAFCEWLSKKEGKKYRLPTQIEWEYACRGGTETRYWCGDEPEDLAKIANVPDGTYVKKEKTAREVGMVRIARGQTAAKKPNWVNQSFADGWRITYEDKIEGNVALPTWTKTDPAKDLAPGRVKIRNLSSSVLVVSIGNKEYEVDVNKEREFEYVPILQSLTIESEDKYAGLAPVGRFASNPFGLYDMHGNVWEWCSDTMKDADGKDVYVIRGGCFL